MLTVLQYLKHYEGSYPSKRTTITSKPVGRDAVVYVRVYVLLTNKFPHILNLPRFHLFYFNASNNFKRGTVSHHL